MAVKRDPITGEIIEETMATNSPVNPEGLMGDQPIADFTTPKATVATEDQPIINRGVPETTQVQTTTTQQTGTDQDGQSDVRVTKLGEVLSDEEKRQLIDQERNRIRSLTGISFDERNKMFRDLDAGIQSGSFFGGETQLSMERQRAEDQKSEIERQTQEALTQTEDLFRKELERNVQRIKEQGQRVMDTTQRLNSLRGAGRSSANERDIQNQQREVNDLISSAQRDSDLRLQKRQMEIEGASGEAIAGINAAIKSNEELLNQRINEAIETQKAIDGQLGLTFEDSLGNMLNLAAAAGVNVDDFDEKATQALGYIADSKGRPLITDANGNPVAPKNQFGMDAKVTNFKDGNDNTYVYTNGELTSIITRDGNILQGEQLNTVNVPAEVKEDKSIAQRRDLESQLRKEFAGRQEVKRFNEIKAQFERVRQGAEADTAAGDLALIFSFMKMLDPASVVREGEFATAQNAAGVPDQIKNLYNKAITGERLNPNQRTQFKTTAENLFKSEVDVMQSLQDDFKEIIIDSGGRPDFVIVGPEFEFKASTGGLELDESDNAALDEIFPSSGGEGQIFKSGGKEFKLNFNVGDQTSGTKGFEEQMQINRTGTNVAKDTNNPGNITADSIPSGFTKEEYGKQIGAVGTYLSPNGREYFVFGDVNSGIKALQRDLQAKISGRSANIKPTDTLEKFQRVYVGESSPGYLSVLERITGVNRNTPIKDINPELLTKAVMQAEGFI